MHYLHWLLRSLTSIFFKREKTYQNIILGTTPHIIIVQGIYEGVGAARYASLKRPPALVSGIWHKCPRIDSFVG